MPGVSTKQTWAWGEVSKPKMACRVVCGRRVAMHKDGIHLLETVLTLHGIDAKEVETTVGGWTLDQLADGTFDAAQPWIGGIRHPVHHGQILAFHAMRLELRRQPVMRAIRLGNDQVQLTFRQLDLPVLDNAKFGTRPRNHDRTVIQNLFLNFVDGITCRLKSVFISRIPIGDWKST